MAEAGVASLAMDHTDFSSPTVSSLTVLSERDTEWFLALLENPPPPNAALRRAAQRYREMVVERAPDPPVPPS